MVYGDAVFPKEERCFNKHNIEGALKALKRIGIERGSFRKNYERMSGIRKKKRNF